MKKTRGTKHKYLGMDIELKNKKVYISMKEYIKEAIKDFGEAINCAAKTPAGKDLMTIPVKEKKLSEESKSIFHSVVQKLLYVSIRLHVA